LIRRWLSVAFLAILTAGASTLTLRVLSPALFQDKLPSNARRAETPRNHAEILQQVLSQPQSSRPVYPYSVVPGGVEDVKELKWVAEHDPVVAAHYAGFDYARAQVVRLTLARTVYVSYRIGNHIYWSSHRVTLRKGEKLITDGRLTARTRCANRVEETPQQEAAAPVEPPLAKFDEPVRAGSGTAMQLPPVPFESALLGRPQAPGLEPAGPLSLYDPFVGGNLVAFAPPPFPEGVCEPVKKKGSSETEPPATSGKKKKLGPCGGGSGGTVPEPATWILFGSGLLLLFWQARHRFVRA
jgi:hypothetical protein